MCDVPFQYSKREDRYTEFVGNSTDIIFVVAKRDQEFVLGQRCNASNVSSNSTNFRQFKCY